MLTFGISPGKFIARVVVLEDPMSDYWQRQFISFLETKECGTYNHTVRLFTFPARHSCHFLLG